MDASSAGESSFLFSPAELPDDLATYKFISRKDKLIKKGNAEPAIKGLMLSLAKNNHLHKNF